MSLSKLKLGDLFKRKGGNLSLSGTATSSKGFDPKSILRTMRRHWIVATCVIVAVTAGVFGPLVGAAIEADTIEQATARAARMSDINRLTKQTVTPPGATEPLPGKTLNQNLLKAYEAEVARTRDDALQVRTAAVKFNRKDRTAEFDFRRAEADPQLARQMHQDAFDAYSRAWQRLLQDAKVGEAPLLADLVTFLQRRRTQFVSTTFHKADGEELSASELADLQSHLRNERLAWITEAAGGLGVYAHPDDLGRPVKPTGAVAAARLFEWQWHLWVLQDLLSAVRSANGDASPLNSVVKRIEWVRFSPAISSGEDSGGAPPAAPAPEGGTPQAPIDPAALVNTSQYDVSFTGRTSNPLYDVQIVDVRVIADTQRLPEFLEALAHQNFITVLGVGLQPESPFAAAQDGYVYGPAAVSKVTLRLETIWLREWTVQFMPDTLRMKLGTSGAVAGAAATPPSTGT